LTRSSVQGGNNGKKLYVETYTVPLRLEHMERTKYSRMLVWGWFHKSKEFLNQRSNYYLLKDSSIPSGQLQQEREGKVKRKVWRWRGKNQVARFCASDIIFQKMRGNKNKN
jgi:hypothetical protein